MKKILSAILSAAIIAASAAPAFAAEAAELNISADKISQEVSPMLYGAFIEDISKAGDGGLVSNLVYNNSFEYNDTAEENPQLNEAYWEFSNISHTVSKENPLNKNNPSYEKLTISGKSTVTNLGCVENWSYKTYEPNKKSQAMADMGFKKGEKYDFSMYVKNVDFSGTVRIYLDSPSNKSHQTEIDISNSESWRKFEAELESAATEDGGLAIEFNGTGTLCIDFVQLIPQSSYGYGNSKWKYTTLRSDLVNALKALNPAFIRFPGGCFCEGDSLDNLYNWKDTIGPLESRRQGCNIWRNDEAGDYYINSNSLGYGEYFNLCSDLGAEPVPCLSAGITCQGRNGYDINVDALKKLSMSDEEFRNYLITERNFDKNDAASLDNRIKEVEALGYTSEADFDKYLETIALTPGTHDWQNYVQDILDLIEYANGDSTTTYWGAVRAANGHSEPYNLKYIGIGNENWGEVYWRNFDAIYKAIKAKYPNITIITTAGTWLGGKDFDTAQSTVNGKYRDCYIDEHYYTDRNYMYEINNRYDGYDRSGAKVFVGEYAAKASKIGTIQTKSNMAEALEEAAYMTGFERNSDVVAMASYAPTFAKINSQNWDVNMIWFDSQSTVLTPSYYTQLLFSNNIGTKHIDAAFARETPVSELAQSVTINEQEQAIYIKLINSSGKAQTVNLNLSGFGSLNAASNQYISANYKSACNEIGKANYISPQCENLAVNGETVTVNTGKYSVNVIRIAYGTNNGATLYELPEEFPKPEKGYLPPAVRVAVPCAIGAVIIAAVLTGVCTKMARKKKSK